jgi:hypothetical protein
MAKQAYVYSGTDWVPLASEVTNLSDYQTKAATGLVLLNTTSFSGVTSVSLPADTFTSTYENYRIIYKFTPVNSDVVFARLRAAGVDATAAQYNPATFFVRTGGTTGVSSSNANQTSAVFESIVGGQKNHLILDVIGPKLAEYTTVTSHHLMGVSASDQKTLFGGFQLSNTTAYDSMSLIMGSGNLSGKVSAYGYNL